MPRFNTGARQGRAAERLNPPRCSPLTLISTPLPACWRSVSRIARGVGVDLHDRYFVPGFADVLVERDQAWLVGLDELEQARHTLPLAFELPRLEPVGGDEDER